jgi:hypothetical protein
LDEIKRILDNRIGWDNRVLMTAATIIGISAAPTLAGAQVVVETGL